MARDSRVKQSRTKFRKLLQRLPIAARTEIAAEIERQGEVMAVDMRRLAPKESGELSRSIQSRDGREAPVPYATLRFKGAKGDPELARVLSAGNTKVRYAHLVEFGTAPHTVGGIFAGAMHPGTPPRPFFFPVFRARKKSASQGINKAVRRAIKKAVREAR